MSVKSSLWAYHNDPAVKAKHVSRMETHMKADELVRLIYWENGKGCAVGCTIHSDDHAAYETDLGWPQWLAHLEDTMFEGMAEEAAQQFPLRLLTAVPVGFSDWDCLYHDFCTHVLRDICAFNRKASPDVVDTVDAIIRLHVQWMAVEDHVWLTARSAAESAARSAQSADQPTASSVAWAASRTSARSARSAAQSTMWAIQSAQSAAWMAQSAAESMTRSAAESAARYGHMGDWLVKWFTPTSGVGA